MPTSKKQNLDPRVNPETYVAPWGDLVVHFGGIAQTCKALNISNRLFTYLAHGRRDPNGPLVPLLEIMRQKIDEKRRKAKKGSKGDPYSDK